jgi:hypothetical protein
MHALSGTMLQKDFPKGPKLFFPMLPELRTFQKLQNGVSYYLTFPRKSGHGVKLH